MDTKKLFLIIFALVLVSLTKVFSQFSIDGELRPRAEVRNGFRQVRDSASQAAGFVSQRSRITLNYKTDALVTKIALQDVRVWGDEKLRLDIPSAAVHEAWCELKVFDSLSLKVGRQEISYGNQRLLGAVNWLQQAVSHDAAIVKFHYNGWTADLGFSYNQTHDTILSGTFYPYNNNYKSLAFMWLTKKINTLTLTGVAIADNFQKAKDTSYTRITFGGIVEYKIDKLTTSAHYYLQSGKTVKGQEISAYYFNVDIAYALGKLKPNAGVEFFSGNDNSATTNKKLNAFNGLYGTGHKFNGSMEYFLNPGTTKNAGLVDIYLGTSYKATEKVSCKADYHYFSIQNDYLNTISGSKIDKYLGSELDLSLKADFSKEVSLEMGYSFLVASKSLEVIQGRVNDGRLNSWAFAVLTIKPVFFKN